MVDLLMGYKIKKGQSHLARSIFEEARGTGNISYSFCSPVSSITDTKYGVKIETRTGTYNASKAIVTVPLNVMHKIRVRFLLPFPLLCPTKLTPSHLPVLSATLAAPR
jgi:monoamine oxidase